MKLKLADLALVADLVTIDSCDTVDYDGITTSGTIEFELSDETFITLVDKEIEFTDKDDSVEFVTVDGRAVVCQFFMRKYIRVADILENLPNLK